MFKCVFLRVVNFFPEVVKVCSSLEKQLTEVSTVAFIIICGVSQSGLKPALAAVGQGQERQPNIQGRRWRSKDELPRSLNKHACAVERSKGQKSDRGGEIAFHCPESGSMHTQGLNCPSYTHLLWPFTFTLWLILPAVESTFSPFRHSALSLLAGQVQPVRIQYGLKNW